MTVTDRHKVVILLATLNGAEFLSEQLKSYADQTHPNWELIVSDDGSSDGTVELIRNFAKSFPAHPVTFLEGPRQGFCPNFLSLVRRCASDADFIAYSDQDDIWSEQKLEKALAYLTGLPADVPAVYFTRAVLIAESGEYAGLSPEFKRPPSFRNALVQNIGGGNTMVFNRAALSVLQATPDLPIVSHDWWTYQLITGVGGIAYYDPWPSIKYRQHGSNLIGSNAGIRASTSRMRALLRGRYSEWNDANIEALTKMKPLLSPQSAVTLDYFSRSTKAGLPKRMYLVWKSGVYRQTFYEHIGLYTASIINKI
jgi:glycosyltransferase involved in cell wall biosynthesis